MDLFHKTTVHIILLCYERRLSTTGANEFVQCPSEQLHIIQSHALEAGLKTANIVFVSGEVMRHNMETGNGISLHTTLFFLGFMHRINNSLSGISK